MIASCYLQRQPHTLSIVKRPLKRCRTRLRLCSTHTHTPSRPVTFPLPANESCVRPLALSPPYIPPLLDIHMMHAHTARSGGTEFSAETQKTIQQVRLRLFVPFPRLPSPLFPPLSLFVRYLEEVYGKLFVLTLLGPAISNVGLLLVPSSAPLPRVLMLRHNINVERENCAGDPCSCARHHCGW